MTSSILILAFSVLIVKTKGVLDNPSPVQLPPEVAEEEMFKLLNPVIVGTSTGTNS